MIIWEMEKSKGYENIDGLKTIAALGIVAVHVAKNIGYQFDSFFYTDIICRMESFVNLFFVISGFGMFYGYYEKIKYNQITLNEFYQRRFKKMWPFFSLLVIADMIYSWVGLQSMTEAFAEITMVFAFLPGPSFSIMGVGWTLGVIFAFYLLFPFFVFCLWNYKRAFISLGVSLVYMFGRQYYFIVEGREILCNILRWTPYFILGGVLYLFRKEIKDIVEKRKILSLGIVWLFLVIWATVGSFIKGTIGDEMITLFASATLLCYAIGSDSRVLSNVFTRFISKYSFEVYLLHMIIFRLVSLICGNYWFDTNSVMSFVLVYFLVVLGSLSGAVMTKKGLDLLINK